MSKAIDRLKLKVPPGKQLPGEFSLITSNRLPLTIAWSSLKSYGLKKSAELELLPFIQLADGSLVGVWYAAAPPAIVFVDAHGESPRVLAKDFSNFLRSISASQTGVPDIDEDCADTFIPGYTARPSRSGITALQKKLDAWVQQNSALEQPKVGKATEALRKRTHAAVKAMIRDGRSRVYGSRDYWSMDFRVKRARTSVQIEYLDYGKWYVLPSEYGLESMIADLFDLMKDPRARKCELTVTKDGIVSIDDDRQLVLVPPL